MTSSNIVILAKEISKLGAKTTTQGKGVSALQPHKELSLELKSFEPELLRAGVLSPQHKKIILDTVLKDEGSCYQEQCSRKRAAESIKAVGLIAKRNSYLLKLLKTGVTLRESIDNLESLGPVGSSPGGHVLIGIDAGPTGQGTGVDAVKLEVSLTAHGVLCALARPMCGGHL